MGLIKAGIGAVGGVISDQWREYFYCESMDESVLVAKGQKRISKRSSNTKGEQNIISNGSIIAVNDGQCMIIVEQGKVAELCAEPGEFVYDASTEPSVFYGNLSDTIPVSFSLIGKRFKMGGDSGKDQRIYFFNTKEILGNKYGTANPVPFRVVDKNIGLDIDISIRCNGEYSYKIVNPMLFYTNVCGNVEDTYSRDEIDSMLKSELLTALQPAFAKISEIGVRYSAIPGHTMELADALNTVLSEKWSKLRGIEIASLGVNSVNASKEDEDMIKQLQKSAVMRNPTMAAAAMVGAQSDAMRMAASNENGAMMGFMGMGMAQQAGGINAQNLFAMGNQQPQQIDNCDGWKCECGATGNNGKFCSQCGKPKPSANDEWICICGTKNIGKFCCECAKPRPESNGWTCSCGTINKGKFCCECAKPKPTDALLYKCDKCGWEPLDPQHPPKFCPECGDLFNNNDISR
ncbi:SPFH domain-containing protein [Paludicola sp. MB14-C6]|uniref:SPFH domain-containing protein n=1 Tax=Paludihabitans sp. MB14-C6 TaxID=3070656 RepID=UPI0027DDA4DA|nr:SPFH domain-containing protein [Paludicola sp. MB14-C6]WMJ22348.1 SPFH domain-containing protein [Paludicola sp. MB14-C6]